jgi:hypothetical protein
VTGVSFVSSLGVAVVMRKELVPALIRFMETSPNLLRDKAFRTVVQQTRRLARQS